MAAVLALAGCAAWYDPSRDPHHLDRCERGEVQDFCR